ncbi:MAG: rhodanese-like domain-containing protein [Fulvivirga sp.]
MFGFGKPSKYKNIDPATFEALSTKTNTVIIDVRTSGEVAEEAIPNHININFMSPDFGKKIQALDRDNTYLLYCRSGARSASACKKMSKLGFDKLYNLSGGIRAWKKDNR